MSGGGGERKEWHCQWWARYGEREREREREREEVKSKAEARGD